MRRETDPDIYCPQAALVSEETIRETQARLEKYRERIKAHKELLERREMELKRGGRLQGTTVVVGASVVAAGLLFWYSRRKGKSVRRGKHDQNTFNKFSVDNTEQLQQEFTKASSTAKSFPSNFLDTRDQLMLYGLYKQATVGDRNVAEPSKLNISASEKYKAWGKFSGIPKQFAMQKYIEVVNHFANGGESAFSSDDGGEDHEEEELDEDGCPVNAEDDGMNGLGIRQSTLSAPKTDDDCQESTPDSQLRHAAINSNTESLQQAIAARADVNSSDESGQSPLHFAADRGNLEIINLLLSHGANVNAVDCVGIGVLQTAVMAGHVEVAKLLLEQGADPDAQDEDGDTPRGLVEDNGGSREMAGLFELYSKAK